MYNDSLYRVSFKCLIQDDAGRVLVVKERDRSSWDLPGGGIDHGETIKDSIQRELKEETAYEDGFIYAILAIDDPVKLLTRDVWQLKVIIKVTPETMEFRIGKDADQMDFIDQNSFEDSDHESERRIYDYAKLVTSQRLAA